MKPSVWIVGLPRCGTRSLCEALRILGWNPIHNPRHWDELDGHDAAGDVLIAAHWRELFRMMNGSRFILSTRPFDEWMRSQKAIPGFWKSSLFFDAYHRETLYGTHRMDDRERLLLAWGRHHAEIRSVIPADRLLELPMPFAWRSLCAFLGVRVPAEPFPVIRGTPPEIALQIHTA